MWTVGIAAYNIADYISAAISSALSQNAKVIVSDDCSTDCTREVIDSFYRGGAPIERIYHNENSGNAVRAWNEFIDACTTEYLFLLSGDDSLLPGALNALSVGGDWVHGDVLAVYPDGREERWDYAEWPHDHKSALRYAYQMCALPVTMMAGFRVAWLRENGLRATSFTSTSSFADTATGIDWLRAAPDIRYVHAPVVRYLYKRDGSETVTGDREAMQQELRLSFLKSFCTPP